MIVIQGVGDLTVGERVDALRDERGQRSFAVALHLRLREAYRGLPAGTEFVVGYADAAAAVPASEDGAAGDRRHRARAGRRHRGAGAAADAGHDPDRARLAARVRGSRLARHVRDAVAAARRVHGRRRRSTRACRPALLSGEYAFPVLGGATFSDEFGAPRATTGFHQGIDLFAPHGTPLLAVHDGVVFRVGWNNLGGRRLWLDDGQGNLFYYAHLSAFSPIAQENAIVRKGQVIGFMGNSGDAEHTPAHLHFEIHPQGQWAVPPFEYMTAWQGQPVAQPAAATPSDDASGTRGLASVDTLANADATAVDDPGEALPGADIAQASGLDLEELVEASKGVDPVAAVSAQRAPADAASADGAVPGSPPASPASRRSRRRRRRRARWRPAAGGRGTPPGRPGRRGRAPRSRSRSAGRSRPCR